MSGNKQHYIPRSLLKGFAQRCGKDGQVSVIKRKNRYTSNIKDVAAARHFYGKSGPGSLDDVITDFEGRFGNFFHNLRVAKTNEVLDVREIGTMLAHLFLRSLALRETQSEMMRSMFLMLEEFGSDQTSVGSAFDQYVDDEKWLRKSINEEFLRNGHKLSEAQMREAVLLAKEKYQAERPSLVPGLGKMIENGARQMQTKASANAEATQLRLLTQFAENGSALIARFASLQWRLIDFSTSEFLVLGDCPVVILGDQFNASNITTCEWSGAFLPLSSERVLLGCSEDGFEISAVDIRKAVIRTAHEFLVCHPNRKSADFDLQSMGAGRIENSSTWRETRAEIREALATPLT